MNQMTAGEAWAYAEKHAAQADAERYKNRADALQLEVEQLKAEVKRANSDGWTSAIESVRATLHDYPEHGGDFHVMLHVARIVDEATEKLKDEIRILERKQLETAWDAQGWQKLYHDTIGRAERAEEELDNYCRGRARRGLAVPI